jgi:outer membrane receptor protein involved in Fe transport
VICVSTGAPAALWAQGNTATMAGVVMDTQRLPIPGARVAARDPDRGWERAVETRANGEFELVGLLPGRYRLDVQVTGFTFAPLDVTLEVNQRLRLDLLVAPSAQSEAVTVRQDIPLLQTMTVGLGQVIDEQQVARLPLNGRQFLELALLVPGVHGSHGAQTGGTTALYWRPGQNSAVSVTGGRPNSNSYLLDGTTNTDPSFNTYIISLPPDAIKEFRIETGTYTAELGGAGTGQVNVVTKSGAASWHGSLYDHLRNSAFDARLFTSPEALPHFAQNQFGATLSGPLPGRRTFYFVSYEGLRSAQGQSMMMSVPPEQWRDGDFSGGPAIFDPQTTRANPAFDAGRPAGPQNPQFLRDAFPGNRIPANRLDPVALRVLQGFVPMPTMMDEEVNNYIDTREQRLKSDLITARVDHAWDSGPSFFARYSTSHEYGFTPENLPGFGAAHDNRVQNLTLTFIQPLSSRIVHEMRAGATRMQLGRLGEKAYGDDLISELGIRGVGFGGAQAYGLPQFNVQGFQPFGDSLLCTPCKYDNVQFQAGDRLSLAAGSHSISVGGNVRRFRWDMLGFFQNRGYFQFTPGFTSQTGTNDGTGSALASYLLGLPALAQRQAGTPSMNMRQTAVDAYVQDEWRLRPDLTLNLGVRYEFQTPLRDVRKILTNLIWQENGQPLAFVAGQDGSPKGLVYPDKNNFAPRLGASYNPGGGPYVVRAGYGMFYSYPDMNLWCNQVHNVPLVFPEIVQSNNFTPSMQGFGFDPAVLGRTLVAFTAIDPHGRTPYIQQASLNVERQLGANLVFELGYVGAWGRNLDRSVLVNNAAPSPLPLKPRRPVQTIAWAPGTVLPEDLAMISQTFPVGPINLLENTARSSYNAGYILARRKLADGLSFLASYTYARSMTDAPAFRSPAMEPEVPQDSFNLADEWGPAGCDIRHRLVASVLLQLPFAATSAASSSRWVKAARQVLGDWQLAIIEQVQSGFPFTISVFGDTANAGALLNVNPVRANVVPGVSPYLPDGERSADHWFNTAAFATPAAYTFGNAGRNSVYGPSLRKTDVALQRNFVLAGRTAFELRAEVFNLFNHTNLATPERFVNTPQFGTVTMAATSARQIQLVGRLRF